MATVFHQRWIENRDREGPIVNIVQLLLGFHLGEEKERRIISVKLSKLHRKRER